MPEKGNELNALKLFPDYKTIELKVLSELDRVMVEHDLSPSQFIEALDKYKEQYSY